MSRHLDEFGFSFTNVQIFRDQELGHGSYGAVYRAKCDSLPCAAKLIYPVLFASNVPQVQQAALLPGREHRQPMRRFEAECAILSQIKHPNIVQYLGVYHDPETNVPVLLMELMDDSLTHFLDSSENPILFHIQVNILHDTALALAFLHSNRITHRDLSSNNVLLIAGNRAKVTDFGMSTLVDATAPHLASMTQCPGTPAYMSPEALEEPPVYSEKLDCFSFGVLMIQIITREFPKPTDRFQIRELIDPIQTDRRIQARVLVSELERRQSHISLIPAGHPLKPIALDCIRDRDVERPTAEQLCETLEQLKSTRLYASSVQQVRDRDLLVTTQRQAIEEKDQQIQDNIQQIQDKDLQIRDNMQQIQDKDQQIWERDQQNIRQEDHLQSVQQENQQLRKMLELKNKQITELQQRTPQHEQTPRTHVTIVPQADDLQPQLQQLQLSEDEQTGPEKKPAPKELTLTWRKGSKAPAAMSRGSSTIIGETFYINPNDRQDVYSINCTNLAQWTILTQCPYKHTTLTTINGMLTTVGGMNTSLIPYNPTNKLITFHDQKWVELYPPMPTERYYVTVFSTTTHVAVMGGNDDLFYLSCVEIMTLQTKQWSTAIPLPFCIRQATATLCGGILYLIGGRFSTDDYMVLSCQFSELLRSAKSTAQTQSSSFNVWCTSILPVRRSTCVTVHGKVLAIGGRDRQNKITSSVYEHNTDNNEWFHKNDMSIERMECLAATLPNNNILVVGGLTGGRYVKRTDETETATICYQ